MKLKEVNKLMKMYVPFYYEKCGRIEVEANNIKEAQKKRRLF